MVKTVVKGPMLYGSTHSGHVSDNVMDAADAGEVINLTARVTWDMP